MLFYIWMAVVIAIDQWSKYRIRATMEVGDSVPVLDRVLNLTFIYNKGAAFSILQGQTWFFLLAVLAVLAGVLYARHRGSFKGKPMMEIGAAVLLGGAIGNAIDRVAFGQVTDFFEFKFVHFAIFNVADVAVDAGAVLIGLSLLLSSRKDAASAAEKPEGPEG